MELEKFSRQLRLLLLLVKNRKQTIDEVSAQLGMSRRSMYRYIDAFRKLGFIIKKEGMVYRIDHESDFLQALVQGIQFTEEEALIIARTVNSVYDNSPEMRSLRDKLAHIYNIDALTRYEDNNQMAFNLSQIYRCIREERVAMFRDYSDENSVKPKNHIVEPYIYMASTHEVRCYDLTTKSNRSFKVDNIGIVETFDLLWSNKALHTPYHTDLFGFSGEKHMHVSLLLTPQATAWLLRSNSDAQRDLTLQDGNCQKLDTLVCSYEGVARFVLSMYDEVQIVDSPELQAYVDNEVAKLLQKNAKASAKLKKA